MRGAGGGSSSELITCGYFGFFFVSLIRIATFVEGQSLREEVWALFTYCGGLLWSFLVWYFQETVHVDMIN